uniref:Uncharacterized protein n=1 Tax=Arundo donax TaxID=35708 RepID=A0A0A9DIA9_ARUDO
MDSRFSKQSMQLCTHTEISKARTDPKGACNRCWREKAKSSLSQHVLEKTESFGHSVAQHKASN